MTQKQAFAEKKAAYQAFETIYDQVVELDKELAHQQTLVEKAQKEATNASNKLQQQQKEQQEQHQQHTQQQTALAQTQEWLNQHQHYAQLATGNRIRTIDQHWRTIEQQQKVLKDGKETVQKQQKALNQTLHDSKSASIALKETEEQAQRIQAAYQEICAEQGWDQQRPIAAYVQWLGEQQQERTQLLQALERVQEVNQQYQRLLTQYNELEEQLADQLNYLGHLDQRLLDEEQRRSDAYQSKLYYEATYERYQQESSLSSLRGALKEGDPCPLCYSEAHPFREKGIDVDLALRKAQQDRQRAEKQWQQADKAFHSTLAEQRTLWRTINDYRQRQQNILPDLYEWEDRLQQLFQQEKPLTDKHVHGQQLQSTLQRLRQEDRQYQQLQQELTKLDKQQTQAQGQLEKAQVQLDNLQQQKQQQKQQLDELQATVVKANNTIQEETEALQLLLKPYPEISLKASPTQQLETYQHQYTAREKQLQEQTTAIEVLNVQLKNSQKEIDQLQQQVTSYQSKAEQQTQQLTALQAERQALYQGSDIKADKANWQQELEHLEQALEGHQEAYQQAQKTISALEGQQTTLAARRAELTQQLQQETATLLGQLTQAGFADLAALQASLLPAEQVQQYTAAQKAREQRQVQLEQQQAAIGEQLAALQAKGTVSTEAEATLKEAYADAQQQHKTMLQDIGKLEQQLQQQAERQGQHQRLLEQIAAHQKEVTRWAALKNLIGAKNGKPFRAFAQSLTLDKLVLFANRYLSAFLDKRYFLQKRSIDHSINPDEWLEIDIVDTFQFNNTRPVHTLSGGESFLVSLALALALSDLASGQARIESLFVDEGFGTLDQQTLQLAMRALQTLQAQGKTVGIISHVEQLKQSISPQIQVTKRGRGFSKVTLKEI